VTLPDKSGVDRAARAAVPLSTRRGRHQIRPGRQLQLALQERSAHPELAERLAAGPPAGCARTGRAG